VSGIGPQGRPRSGRRSWTSTPPGACWMTEKKVGGCSRSWSVRGRCACSLAGIPGVDSW